MRNTDELRRLLSGPRPGEVPPGPLVRLRAECGGDAGDALQSLREVWATVLWQEEPGRLGEDDWKLILPRWFVGKFDPGIRTDDPLLKRAFQLQDRMRPPEAWTLAAWMRTLDPLARRWSWWSAEIQGAGALEITIATQSPDAEVESLQWLMRCAGAQPTQAA